MELKILKHKENPLLNRKEAEISIESNVAPKISEAEAFVAKEFSSSADSVKIRKIKGNFGSNKFFITADIYHSKEDKERIEPKAKKGKSAENKPEENKQ